jgi:eukaryotic-like serine/threonine-protein kinase
LEESTGKKNQTAEGLICGTVNYMSPEQAKGEQIDERTDIFSLGVVIYETIAGRTPFAGDSTSETFANLINAEPLPLSRFAANVPTVLRNEVGRPLVRGRRLLVDYRVPDFVFALKRQLQCLLDKSQCVTTPVDCP